jgi:hypothetical protein
MPGAAPSFKHAMDLIILRKGIEEPEQNPPHPSIPPEVLFRCRDVRELGGIHHTAE